MQSVLTDDVKCKMLLYEMVSTHHPVHHFVLQFITTSVNYLLYGVFSFCSLFCDVEFCVISTLADISFRKREICLLCYCAISEQIKHNRDH